MITIDNLKLKYKPGIPILLENLENEFEYTKTTIRKSMSLLNKSGEVKRFARGVYYIPEKTIFGDSKLNPNKVIKAKYFGTDENVSGIYAGLTLLNQLGLTTQVPNNVEVTTNCETNIKREILLGKQKVILRRSKVKINNDNVKVIELLEAIRALRTIPEDKVQKLTSIISMNNMTRKQVDRVLIYYPRNVYKNLVESGLIYEFAS